MDLGDRGGIDLGSERESMEEVDVGGDEAIIKRVKPLIAGVLLLMVDSDA